VILPCAVPAARNLPELLKATFEISVAWRILCADEDDPSVQENRAQGSCHDNWSVRDFHDHPHLTLGHRAVSFQFRLIS